MLLLCLGSSSLHAQVSASLSAIVTDQSGAVVGGADVTGTNLDTGFVRHAVTDAAGRYQLFALVVNSALPIWGSLEITPSLKV